MFTQDDLHAWGGSKSKDERDRSSPMDVCYQKGIELTSRNITWPTVTWLSEAVPLTPQKRDDYLQFPITVSETIRSVLYLCLLNERETLSPNADEFEFEFCLTAYQPLWVI